MKPCSFCITSIIGRTWAWHFLTFNFNLFHMFIAVFMVKRSSSLKVLGLNKEKSENINFSGIIFSFRDATVTKIWLHHYDIKSNLTYVAKFSRCRHSQKCGHYDLLFATWLIWRVKKLSCFRYRLQISLLIL